MLSSLDASPTASMDPWMNIHDGHAVVLFGYCLRHPRLGGRSWVRSSELVAIDPFRGRAQTASGGIYLLGRRISVDKLPDDEARGAFALLIGPASRENLPEDDEARAWLQAVKMARWIGIDAPSGRDTEAIWQFIEMHLLAYAALRQDDLRDRGQRW